MTIETDERTTTESTALSQRMMPWERPSSSVDVSDAMTADEAMHKAGLDWDLELQPAFRAPMKTVVDSDGNEIMEPDKDKMTRIKERWAVVRTDTDQELSVVSERYKPFGNGQAFSFLDNLVKDEGAKFHTALSVRGGRSVAVSMYLPGEYFIGGDDQIQLFVLFRTSHDGSSRIRADVTPVRLFCTNQFGHITRTTKASWGVTHTADVDSKLKEARETLQLSVANTEELIAIGETLAATRVTKDHLETQLKMVIPHDRKKRDDEIAQILSVFETSENIANFRETGWGAVNAWTEWSEHIRTNRSGDAAFGRLIDGKDAEIRQQLTRRILAAAA